MKRLLKLQLLKRKSSLGITEQDKLLTFSSCISVLSYPSLQLSYFSGLPGLLHPWGQVVFHMVEIMQQ